MVQRGGSRPRWVGRFAAVCDFDALRFFDAESAKSYYADVATETSGKSSLFSCDNARDDISHESCGYQVGPQIASGSGDSPYLTRLDPQAVTPLPLVRIASLID